MDDDVIQRVVSDLAGSPSRRRRPRTLASRLDAFISKVNRVKFEVYHEHAVVLTEICRLIDADLDTASAWSKVDDVEKTGVYGTANGHNDLQRTVSSSILESSGAYVNRKANEIASGVFVAIENRVFLATTSHSIPNNPISKLSFIGSDLQTVTDAPAPILSFAKEDDYVHKDVGFIELEPDFVRTGLGKSAIPLSRVFPCGTGQEGYWTYASGYPASEVVTSQVDESFHQLYTLQAWANTILPPHAWTALTGAHRDPDELLDVFIAYTRNERVISIGEITTSNPNQLPVPYGMSGGGYWQKNDSKKTRIWSPENYSLIAIQSHWWGKGRYLQATQIIHWLRLLWRHNPELRPVLKRAFRGHNLSGRKTPPPK